jgi:hypothetical protein
MALPGFKDFVCQGIYGFLVGNVNGASFNFLSQPKKKLERLRLFFICKRASLCVLYLWLSRKRLALHELSCGLKFIMIDINQPHVHAAFGAFHSSRSSYTTASTGNYGGVAFLENVRHADVTTATSVTDEKSCQKSLILDSPSR